MPDGAAAYPAYGECYGISGWRCRLSGLRGVLRRCRLSGLRGALRPMEKRRPDKA
ncbi:hypothetical protein CIT292_09289 [Citrobacter youngae ATCC 29220]|uniref:Uncharacterized protein n=1 Tax=Citrobacter youngae ATCC 29220 TaxID=500640 RepID=D4BES6_9ENTR|nr:hypothetical protein CIT292_09289 [Citrobacter youngae ATCC 29220]